MAQCYFDQKPSDSGLGKGGKSDYTNYYGAIAFELIHAEMRDRSNPPLIAIDMKKLGLKPSLLESNGLNFHEGSLSFLDISPHKSGQITLHHGGNEKKNSPKEDMDEPRMAQRLPASDPTLAYHPDHFLYQQALAGVKKQDAALGREPDDNSLRLAASLTVLAKENGITRIDNVVFSIDNGRGVKAGEHVFIVQGELNNPGHDRAHMKTTEAITTSVSELFQKCDAINQQQTQQQLMQRNLEQTQTLQQRSLSM